MKLDNMFKKSQNLSLNEGEKEQKSEVPEGLLRKCNLCKKVILTEEVENGYYICPKCGGCPRHGTDQDDYGRGQL